MKSKKEKIALLVSILLLYVNTGKSDWGHSGIYQSGDDEYA
jgi:hypothetical protein